MQGKKHTIRVDTENAPPEADGFRNGEWSVLINRVAYAATVSVPSTLSEDEQRSYVRGRILRGLEDSNDNPSVCSFLRRLQPKRLPYRMMLLYSDWEKSALETLASATYGSRHALLRRLIREATEAGGLIPARKTAIRVGDYTITTEPGIGRPRIEGFRDHRIMINNEGYQVRVPEPVPTDEEARHKYVVDTVLRYIAENDGRVDNCRLIRKSKSTPGLDRYYDYRLYIRLSEEERDTIRQLAIQNNEDTQSLLRHLLREALRKHQEEHHEGVSADHAW